MDRIANDNAAPNHEDQVRALELVRRAAGGCHATLELGSEKGGAYFQRLGCVLQVLKRLGLVSVRRGDDGGPDCAMLTEAGEDVGRRLDDGHIALFPAAGGIRIVEDPTDRAPAHPLDGPEYAEAANTVFEVMAVAPRRYGTDVVEGSATAVLVDRIDRWEGCPAVGGRRREDDPVQRVWEVFSRTGRAYGFILQTASGFDGIDDSGGSRREASLAAAAWQIGVNR